MKITNKKVKVEVSTDSDGYKNIEFTNYSSSKIPTDEFIDTCINTLLNIQNDLQRKTKKWWQFWKSDEEVQDE